MYANHYLFGTVNYEENYLEKIPIGSNNNSLPNI